MSSTPTPTAPSAISPCNCPECDSSIRFDRAPLQGQVVRCGDCGVELEVTSASPITLELAPEVEEDWGE